MADEENKIIRVLIVDDDEDDYIIIRDLFSEIEEQRFRIEWVSEFDQAVEIMKKEDFDVFLVDYYLGKNNGLELLKYAEEHGINNPFILLTGLGDREIDIKAMKSGASDYLIKGEIDHILLERSIRYSIQRKQSQERLKETHTKLVHSEKLAGIGQLAAGIAHEINNPLGYIMSNFVTLKKYVEVFKKIIELSRSQLPREEIQKREEEMKLDFILGDIDQLIEENQNGLTRIKEIVQNLKDFAHIDSVSKIVEADINRAIQNTLTVARNEIKYVAVVKTELGAISPVYCNASEINQVLLNIIINAAHAIKAKGGEEQGILSIKTYENGDSVNIEVVDNGVGISKDHLQKIFDPFFTTKTVGKGTGLGLNIAYDIVVNKHGGEILVDSEVGKGTKMTIRLLKEGSVKNEEG